jgi:hypothetical protein
MRLKRHEPYEFASLAYNQEVAKGLEHTPAYAAALCELLGITPLTLRS